MQCMRNPAKNVSGQNTGVPSYGPMPDIDHQPAEPSAASGAQLLHRDKNAKALKVDRNTAKKGM